MPNPPKPRPGSSSDLRGPILDEQPERVSVNHPGVDGVPQQAPRRSPTLNGLGKSPPIPPAAGLPEFQPTKPAPAMAEVTTRKTVNRPAPPTTMRRATPSPLPALPRPEAWDNGYGVPPPSPSPTSATDERQAVRIEDATTEPPGSTPLPPPSQTPEAARLAALEREATRLRRERDEAREQAKRSAESIRPDGSIASLRKAQTKLYLGIAAALVVLAVPLAAYLTAAAEANRTRSERAAAQAGNAINAADSAKQSASNADKEIAKLRAELAQYRANMREVLRLQGVDVAKHAGDPDANDLDPVVPFCPRGKVCAGPQLQLRNPP